MILVFVKHLNESVRGLRISSEYTVSPVRSRFPYGPLCDRRALGELVFHPSFCFFSWQNVEKAVAMLSEINSWIDEIPPIQQPMRFGNKAYRTFYDRVTEVGLDYTRRD
jgi:hypothetical protein